MKTVHAIPEELICEILHLALLIPEADFYDEQQRETRRVQRKHGVPPAAHILLVCRKWVRIGEPSLYSALCIASRAHAHAVADTFRVRAPALARTVRHVRLDGGFGRELHDVLAPAVGVRTVYVSTMVAAAESVVGLQRALPALRPVRLHVYTCAADNGRRNANAKAIEGMLETMIRTCSSLEQIDFHPQLTMLSDVMVSALMNASPSINAVSFDGYMLLNRFVRNALPLEMMLARNTHVKRIVCRRSGYFKSNLQYSRLSKVVKGVLDYQ
ncbi:hypothetical protein PsYK624_080710 [Phanerochaete sordida]|uniref:Uncharacterized protein n=1 Tax=Phanerochaete sordida TaxID=48140 RepID=A0A9P3GCM8_9APHY|nr:hypothetical protein PsYK624_080710 [Phanerochaete sordida]